MKTVELKNGDITFLERGKHFEYLTHRSMQIADLALKTKMRCEHDAEGWEYIGVEYFPDYTEFVFKRKRR